MLVCVVDVFGEEFFGCSLWIDYVVVGLCLFGWVGLFIVLCG